jgi:hypothetical protein
MKICSEFWDEFINFAKLLYKYMPDPEVYDVLMFIRELNGSQPFSDSLLKTIDGQIERELNGNKYSRTI